MSKLIDKLKLASQAAPQAMGFRPKHQAPTKPTMLLIASLMQANVDGLADYVSGADAGLLRISAGSRIKPFQKVSQAMPDLPWDLPVNAVLVTAEGGEGHFLTWHHLMLFQRFSSLLTKPLLVTIPSNVAAKELQVLWEAGVDGVVVEVEAEKPAGKLPELRQTIDKLSPRSSHKQGRAGALLPRITEGAGSLPEEPEEEEE